MGKVTEKDIAAFIYEFAHKINEIAPDMLFDECGLPKERVMLWGQKSFNITVAIDHPEEVVLLGCVSTESDVREFCDNERCIAYLDCEGKLYETMYNYEAYGAGGEKAEKLYGALMSLSDKYGMLPVWSSGTVVFYDEEDYLNYISDEYSVCREERQYALFLNNILLKYRKWEDKVSAIYTACGIPEDAEILNVFYEATFMRDIFERNRRIHFGAISPEKSLLNKSCSLNGTTVNDDNRYKSFNDKLIKHVTKSAVSYNGDEVNLGKNKIVCKISDDSKEEIQAMMNSKPDIAVIYKQGKQKYLLFIECKFESSESKKGDKKQTEIQWKIADFLCNKENGFLTELEISPQMTGKKSRLVQFTRKPAEADNEIRITDLIDFNNEIFCIKQPTTV